MSPLLPLFCVIAMAAGSAVSAQGIITVNIPQYTTYLSNTDMGDVRKGPADIVLSDPNHNAFEFHINEAVDAPAGELVTPIWVMTCQPYLVEGQKGDVTLRLLREAPWLATDNPEDLEKVGLTCNEPVCDVPKACGPEKPCIDTNGARCPTHAPSAK